jgi:hypothetical protein
MTDRFTNLEKACGGRISVESLTEFQQAMREYEVFMDGMGALLRPRDPKERAR